MSMLPLIRWVAVRLLLALLAGFGLGILVFGISSCVRTEHFQSAPRPSRRYTEQRQRQHAQERRQDRRRNHSPISWSGH